MSRYLPGPFCALNLEWLGAHVTAVEQPPYGDPMRAIPPIGDDGLSTAYRSLRRSATVEMLELGPSGSGQDRMLELCANADVLIEGFRPGVAARLGIDDQTLRQLNDRLVYCSISGYGQDGPWSQAPGHDINYESVSGLLGQNGTPDQLSLPAVPLADLAGGLSAAVAICAALMNRERIGRGTTIDISLTEAAIALQAMQIPMETTKGSSSHKNSMLTGGLACYAPYRCADDRWISIGPIEPAFFASLCELLDCRDLEPLQHDPSSQMHVQERLAAIFSARESAYWEQLLATPNGGVSCVTRVLNPSEVPNHPQIKDRGALSVLPNSTQGFMPSSPYVLDGVRTDSV